MSLEKVFHGKNGNFYVFLHLMISFSYYLDMSQKMPQLLLWKQEPFNRVLTEWFIYM